MRGALALLVAVALLPLHGSAQMGGGLQSSSRSSSTHAESEEPMEPQRPNPAVMAFDAVILRPLGFVAMCVGAALFVPTVIVASPGGRDGVQTAMEILVLVPTKSVFQRPLGEF